MLEVCNVKPTFRKSWARNFLIWSYLTVGSSFKVEQGQPNIKVLITHVLLVLEVCNVKPTHRKSWAGNLPMLSDLTLGPSFKVTQWFTGFDELSFWWIQICIGSNLRRSSFNCIFQAKYWSLLVFDVYRYTNVYTEDVSLNISKYDF